MEHPPAGYVPDRSGYHFNSATGHYFDVRTSYYFILDAPNQRYLYFDEATESYKVYPPEWPTAGDNNNNNNNDNNNNNNNDNNTADNAVADATAAAANAEAERVRAETLAKAAKAAAKAAKAAEAKAAHEKSVLAAVRKPVKMTFGGGKKVQKDIARWNQQLSKPPADVDAVFGAQADDDDDDAPVERVPRYGYKGRAQPAEAAIIMRLPTLKATATTPLPGTTVEQLQQQQQLFQPQRCVRARAVALLTRH